jgi:predicted ATP-grasp superfamily ATP-dependent carboligase
MMPALVLDGHLKSALTTVRSLGRAGVSVVCASERHTALACHSKFVKESFVYTSPKVNQKLFVEEIIVRAKEIFEKTKTKSVIYCFSDATALSLSSAYERLLEYAVLPLPSADSVETASDKFRTYVLADELSLPTIKTYEESEFNTVTYPAVVKNRHSIVWKDGQSISGSAQFVFSREELQETYRKVSIETGESPLVQEFIEGTEYGVEMLCTKGTVLALFTHKRIRSLSPLGGAAVVKETAENSVEVALMKIYGRDLIQQLKWTGPVMVEFKIDQRDNSVKLMEINGRFWGSLPLAVKSGIDFPLMYHKLAQGEVAENSKDVQPRHLRTRHLLGDVKWLLSVFFDTTLLRKRLYPSRIQAMWDFTTEVFKSSGDIFDIHDLKPSMYEYIDILKK